MKVYAHFLPRCCA